MLYNIFLIMLCFGVVLFISSIILVFALHILDLVDELSGRKAKRQVKRLRELNAGSGVLDGANTTDVYKTVSSGQLFPETQVKGQGIDSFHQVTEEIIKYTTSGNIEDEDEVPTGDREGTEEAETSYVEAVESQETTAFDEEQATSFFDEEDQVTGVLAEIEEYLMSKRNIIIIEEQTSLAQ